MGNRTEAVKSFVQYSFISNFIYLQYASTVQVECKKNNFILAHNKLVQ